MTFPVYFIIFILGLILGSFANVFVLRRGTGRSLGGRSQCLSCNRKLGILDLIPVVSWILLLGRCRGCGTKISWQYPLVEFAMGLGFVGAFEASVRLSPPSLIPLFFALFATIIFLWVSISAYDFRHMAIPDNWSYCAALIAFISSTISFSVIPEMSFSVFFAGPILALPFYALWLISSGCWLGLGDAKLALSVGWLLGISDGFFALLISVIIGAIAGVSWVFISSLNKRKKVTMKVAMPFGPFIVLGAIIVFTTGFTFGDLFLGIENLYGF